MPASAGSARARAEPEATARRAVPATARARRRHRQTNAAARAGRAAEAGIGPGRAMRLWRVSPATTLEDACKGSKAGRWSWASRAVLYTSCTPELAVLEALAHRSEHSAPHWLCAVDLPRSVVGTHVKGLPPDWKTQQSLTRRIGNAWFDGLASPLLLVPSALCQEGSNALVNPSHPQARGLRLRVLRRFDFDRRLRRG